MVDVARVETESFIAFVKVSVGDDVDVILVYYMVFKISLYIYIYIFILYIYISIFGDLTSAKNND